MSGVFVKIRDKQMGPYSSRELLNLAARGEFSQNDLVFHEDSQEWIKAGNMDALRDVFESPFSQERKKMVYAVGGGKGGVGKTILTASLGIGLAALGNRVIIVDADLGGANLHTCMGILEPAYTFYHFYTLQRDCLEDILLDTPIQNLKLISGACGTLGLANPRFSQKQRFITELSHLNADYILVDLGAGSSYNVIDFFIAAEQGILVTTPEPMAIQETFNFVKVSIMRKLLRKFKNSPHILALLDQDVLVQPGRMSSTMSTFLDKVRSVDSEAGRKMEQMIADFRPRLILNMVHFSDEIKEGEALKTAVKELLSVDIDYIGVIEYDENVRESVKELKPFLLQNPKSKASRSLTKLIMAGLLNKTGFKGFWEKRKATRVVSEESQVYPKINMKESETICSFKCFYWGDCEYQKGGYPCSIRHLDPIFRR